MKDVWNLDVIYRGFEDPAFASDLESLQEVVKGFRAFAGTLKEMETLEGLREGIAWEEKLVELGTKLATYTQLRQSVNTRDLRAAPVWGRFCSSSAPLQAQRQPGRNGQQPSRILWSR